MPSNTFLKIELPRPHWFWSSNLNYLGQVCNNLGGDLVVWEGDFTPTLKQDLCEEGWSFAPFVTENVAVHWRNKTIAIPKAYENIGAVIHEMGHVFACNVPPDRCPSEWDWLGWEIALAKKIGIKEWLRNNEYFVEFTHKGIYFATLTEFITTPDGGMAFKALCEDRLKAAKEKKLISEEEEVLSIRS